MQVQRNLSGNYYTESLMSSSLIRDYKALTSLARKYLARERKIGLQYIFSTEILKRIPSCVALQAPSQ